MGWAIGAQAPSNAMAIATAAVCIREIMALSFRYRSARSRRNRGKIEIVIIETEVGGWRHRLHRDAFDLALGVEAEGDERRLDVAIGKAGDESVVLMVHQWSAHPRRFVEIDRQAGSAAADGDAAVPRVAVLAGIAVQR